MNTLAVENPANPPDPAQSPALEQAVMLKVIRESVAQTEWTGKGELFTGSPGQAYPAQTLMRGLIYTVMNLQPAAQGPNDDIEDLSLWRLCDGVRPDWATLREFYQSRREGLQRCLADLVRRAALIRFGEQDDLLMADSCIGRAWDRWFESLCIPARIWEPGEPERSLDPDPRLVLID